MKTTHFFAIVLIGLVGLPVTGQRLLKTEIEYDSFGQIERVEYPDGSVVTYEYDNEVGMQSRVEYDHSSSGDTHMFVHGIELSASGLLTRIDVENGTMTFGYDALNRFTEQRFDHDGNTRYKATGLTYNRWGYLDGYQRQDESVNRTYTYEFTDQGAMRQFAANGRLATYTYDPQGNLTGISGFTDSSENLTVEDYDIPPGEGYDMENHRSDWTYDQAGRLLRDDKRQYYYNQNGRLAMVRDRATGLPVQSNLYDGEGMRVRQTDLLKGETTYSIRNRDGTVLSQKVDHNDSPDVDTNFVLHNGQAIGKVSQEADNDEVVTLNYRDHLGNPAVTIENQFITHHEYGPYGSQMSEPEHLGAHGYTGHEDDGSTQLTYMMARYQDPIAARFTIPDTARDFDLYRPSTLNLYQYVSNDPINRVDPYGDTDIYIGGLGDKSTTIVFKYAKGPGKIKGRTVKYFQQNQFKKALKFAIDNAGNGEPLNIIGHSYGTSTAAKLALKLEKKGIKVDNLIGVDPVGKFFSPRRKPRANTTDTVVTVEAEPSDPDFSDRIKEGGRGTGGIPEVFKNPDATIVVDANHREFGTLFETKGPDGTSAKDYIDFSYILRLIPFRLP